ncbi:MAG: HIT domain-containing protein, partial [Pseudomonadota bacterium]|nr:HIT domain-containing protein [Pseudomonadota bacterium]
MSTSFNIHKQLLADCEQLGNLDLCSVLLMRDARFPWLILVPRIDGLRDLHDLPATYRERAFTEIEITSEALRTYTSADKINVAALGNMVPQLHIHVIGRREDDAGWPAPVWSAGPA